MLRKKLIAWVVSYTEEMNGPVKTISRDELKAKLDRQDSFVLIETLPRVAYDHAHLPQAINIPPDQVEALAPKLLPDKNAEIVVYCASPT